MKLQLWMVCLVLARMSWAQQKHSTPPTITTNEFHELAFKPGEKVELRCEASGDPKPTFTWKRNDVDITYNMTDVRKQPGSGTLVIESPTPAYEGVYQCFARNNYGLAVSVKTLLKPAVMEPFPTAGNKPPPVHRPVIGEGLSLSCKPPYSYPTGTIYWAITESRQDQQGMLGMQAQDMWVVLSDRVNLDYSGRLHFANIVAEDRYNGLLYVCSVQNKVLRGFVQGEDQFIEPTLPPDGAGFDEGAPPARAPTLAWSSQSPTVVLLGQPARMKCIFYGFPTPTVTWERVDAPLKPGYALRSFNLELVVPNVQYSDAGTYRCKGTNIAGAPAMAEIQLIVESMPIFDVKPLDAVRAEDEDVEFECRASGIPAPTLSWLSNGRPLSSLNNPRLQLSPDGTRLTIREIIKDDAQVFQCNASNSHGYAFHNAYLSVQSIPARIITPPPVEKKVAEGQTVIIGCRYEGAPRVTVVWKALLSDPKQPEIDRRNIDDPRFRTLPTGDLEIKDVRKDDTNMYYCYVSNKGGEDEAGCNLQVLEKTQITTQPRSQTVDAPIDVLFECAATADPSHSSRLTYVWERNGVPITDNNPRYVVDRVTHRLTIKQTEGNDTAEYRCVVSSDIDRVEASAMLTVRDKPEAPHNVRYIRCGARSADITWDIPHAHNSPITQFVVYVHTNFDADNVYNEVMRVPADTNTATVPLTPFRAYVFRVIAINALGASEKSAATLSECKIPPERPFVHPSGVCVESRDPTTLTIVWQPMKMEQYNGEDFHYIVSYRPLNDDSASDIKVRVNAPQRADAFEDKMSYSVPKQPTFQPYEISVEAANSLGSATSSLDRYKGYSGQDVPSLSPENFNVDHTSITAKNATFTWTGIDENDERIKGFFIGYKIRFWKTNDPENVRDHIISRDSSEMCSLIDEDALSRYRRAAGDEETGHVFNLWPASKLTAQLHIVNGANKLGPGSTPPLEFETLEGVPGAVSNLRVTEQGSQHAKVEWDPPAEPNGDITGYTVQYKPEDGDEWQSVDIKDPSQEFVKIKNLDPNTAYDIKVLANTKPGAGEEQTAKVQTKPDGAPDKPVIGDIRMGDTSLNVSWTPTANPNDANSNPGQDFVVKYRKPGDAEWKEVKPEDNNNWANISGLTHGDVYEIVIVAKNGNDKTKETPSDTRRVTVGVLEGQGTYTGVDTASAYWLIIILCILLFLLLILLIIFLIYRNRGGKYPVHEKEKLRGRDFNDEEGGFGEYSKPQYMPIASDEPDNKRQTAALLEEDERPLESETDSMAEYDQMDPSKFNEDGSFIGQYGGKKKDPAENAALSTFV